MELVFASNTKRQEFNPTYLEQCDCDFNKNGCIRKGGKEYGSKHIVKYHHLIECESK